MLIKTIFGNGDLESSQWRSGVPEWTARVSVAARDLSFLTEIFGPGVVDAEKGQNNSARNIKNRKQGLTPTDDQVPDCDPIQQIG